MTSSRTVVIGAGPAGLAAAAELLSAGLSVTLIDAGARWGGQFWRHPAGPLDAGLHHDVEVYQSLEADLDRFIANGSLTYLAQHHVWSVEADDDDTDTGGLVHALDRSVPSAPVNTTVRWDHLVLAVGAYDRQLPFPGWDLPGVLTIGGAQALLKGNGVAVGPRVLIAGTGPFLLPVATALAARGSKVVGVHEANHPIGWGRHVAALAQSRHLREAAGYAATLLRHRVRLQHRSMVVAAHGTERLEAVTVARLDRRGNQRAGTERRIPVDVLAVGYGFTAQADLAIAAGCEMQVTDDLALTVVTDENQRTSRPRVFAAGEITGIGGAQLAIAEADRRRPWPGGRAIAGRTPRTPAARRTVAPLRAALHSVYPVPTAWLSQPRPDTIVCRCEEVTVAEIDAAIELGARDNRTVKLLSRAGMGWCQGRECAFATACLTADRTGLPLDLASGAARPIASPVPLGIVADNHRRNSTTGRNQKMDRKPWHGVLVATALPWLDNDEPNLDAFATHIGWLADHGCNGVTPNGSLGEYQVLTDAQRDAVVKTALDAAPEGFSVMPGVGAYGAKQARRHTEFAAKPAARP